MLRKYRYLLSIRYRIQVSTKLFWYHIPNDSLSYGARTRDGPLRRWSKTFVYTNATATAAARWLITAAAYQNDRSVYSVARGNAPENTVTPGPFARAKSKRSANVFFQLFCRFAYAFYTTAVVRPLISLLSNRLPFRTVIEYQ